MAVLASVCDPHLNTIHAVCHKFSESRGLSISGHSLNAPRPVNRPLNLPLDVLSGSNHPYEFPSPSNSSGRSTHLPDLFTTLTPPSDYIPLLGIAGPLSIPFLEPQHPVYGFELDSAGIWTTVLIMVDMSKTDAEALASSLTLRVRCYGFGPVMIEQDVVEICRGPSRVVTRAAKADGLRLSPARPIPSGVVGMKFWTLHDHDRTVFNR